MYGVAVDTKKIEQLLKDFYELTGIRISFISHDLREYITSRKEISSFCQLLSCDPCAAAKCQDCDRNAFNAARENQHLEIYECHAGLTEAVSPIIHGGKLLGYLMMGQTLNFKPNRENWNKIRSKCRHFKVDQAMLEAAFYQLVFFEWDKIHSAARIMDMAAGYILHSGMAVLHNPPLIQNIEQYLSANLDKPLTISSLSRELNISASHLSHVIKSELGSSLTKYLQNLKIEKACELISAENSSIGEIAASLGYQDQNYFTRLFKKHTGLTPTDYRIMLQKKAELC